MYTVLKLFRPFEGNREADVTPGENEFDTPELDALLAYHLPQIIPLVLDPESV